jgi:hypothetical protein
MTRHKTFIFTLFVVVAVAAATGVAFYQWQHVARVAERGEVSGERLSVFFPSEQGRLARKVVDVQRQATDKTRADTLLRELKETRCVPDRLRIHEIALGKDGVLYLDLSEEFIDRNTPEREISMTYGIVNSFIESFSGAKSVQILVEGQPIYTRSGVLYMLDPLRFNKELLEE